MALMMRCTRSRIVRQYHAEQAGHSQHFPAHTNRMFFRSHPFPENVEETRWFFLGIFAAFYTDVL